MDRTKTVIWGLFMSMLPLNMSCTTDKDKSGMQHGGATPTYNILQDREDRLLVELPNRMIVAAQQLHMAPVVSVYSVVKTGSIYEQQASPGHGSGLSHFLEHLVSGGSTTNRTEAESTATLAQMGARTNASTSLDKVRYYINTTSEHTATAVELMSDWLANCTIGQREYARERDVIQREFEMGRGDPMRIFWKLTQRARFTRHPARHPTIGYLDQFLKISRDDIYAFYKQMYAPNNIVFVVVGDAPFVHKNYIEKMILSHQGTDADCSFLYSKFPFKLPYARLFFNKDNNLEKLTEFCDLKKEDKDVKCFFTSQYLFKSKFLLNSIERLGLNEKTGEYNLTDIINICIKEKKRINSVLIKEFWNLMGINNLDDIKKISLYKNYDKKN
mgnify:CR=1 FL=1